MIGEILVRVYKIEVRQRNNFKRYIVNRDDRS